MNLRRTLSVAALVFLFLTPHFFNQPARAQSNPSLGGLTSMFVRVNPEEPSGEQTAGVDEKQVKSDTERQLAEGGIKVLSEQEFARLQRSRGYPLALVDVVSKLFPVKGTDSRIYFVDVKVRQLVFLSRKPVVRLWAATWEMRDIGITADMDLVREKVRDAVSQLVSDYQAENQR